MYAVIFFLTHTHWGPVDATLKVHAVGFCACIFSKMRLGVNVRISERLDPQITPSRLLRAPGATNQATKCNATSSYIDN